MSHSDNIQYTVCNMPYSHYTVSEYMRYQYT